MLFYLIEKNFFLATNPKLPSVRKHARTADGPVLAAPMPYKEELTHRAASNTTNARWTYSPCSRDKAHGQLKQDKRVLPGR